MAQALLDVELEGVVGADTSGLVSDRVDGIAEVGGAEIGVAAFEGAVGLRGERIAVGVSGLLTVAEGLAVNRIRSSCNTWLIEWDGDDAVAPAVAEVAEVNGEGVGGLPLDVEGEVFNVGQCVVDVVEPKGKVWAPSMIWAALGRYLLKSAGLPVGE